MERLLEILGRNLVPAVRQLFANRTRMMISDLRFLLRQQDERLTYLRELGWTLERIELICCICAFYQVVLGPLASPARSRTASQLGWEIPVRYGNLPLFSRASAEKILEADDAFLTFLGDLEIKNFWLQASHASDLVFKMATSLRDEA